MQPAEYHRRGWKAKPCQILQRHDDGTVDLGDHDGNLIVGKCAAYATLPEPGERRPDGWALVTEAAEPPKKKRGRPRKDAPAEPVIESLPEPAPVELDRDPEDDLVDAADAADESAPQI